MLGFTPLAAGPIATSGRQDYIFDVNAGTFAVSGQGAAKLITEFVPDGQYVLNGRAADFSKTMTVDLAAGSFSASGQSVELDRGFGIIVPSGSFSVVGNNALLKVGTKLTADNGSFSISVFDVNILKTMMVRVSSLALTLTGNDIKIQGWLSFANPSETWAETSGASDTWTEQVVQSEAA